MNLKFSPAMIVTAVVTGAVVIGGLYYFVFHGDRDPSSVKMLPTPAAAQHMSQPPGRRPQGAMPGNPMGNPGASYQNTAPANAMPGAGYQNTAPVGR